MHMNGEGCDISAQMQTMNGDGDNYTNREELKDHLFWCTGGILFRNSFGSCKNRCHRLSFSVFSNPVNQAVSSHANRWKLKVHSLRLCSCCAQGFSHNPHDNLWFVFIPCMCLTVCSKILLATNLSESFWLPLITITEETSIRNVSPQFYHQDSWYISDPLELLNLVV